MTKKDFTFLEWYQAMELRSEQEVADRLGLSRVLVSMLRSNPEAKRHRNMSEDVAARCREAARSRIKELEQQIKVLKGYC